MCRTLEAQRPDQVHGAHLSFAVRFAPQNGNTILLLESRPNKAFAWNRAWRSLNARTVGRRATSPGASPGLALGGETAGGLWREGARQALLPATSMDITRRSSTIRAPRRLGYVALSEINAVLRRQS